jgi:hypothetical protein
MGHSLHVVASYKFMFLQRIKANTCCPNLTRILHCYSEYVQFDRSFGESMTARGSNSHTYQVSSCIDISESSEALSLLFPA